MHITKQIKITGIFFLGMSLSSLAASENRLIKLAQDYLRFVHDVGSARSVQSDDARIEILFAQDLTKIDNRSILFENDRQSLLPQMKGFEKDYNPNSIRADWTVDIDSALIIPSIETNSVVINFEWMHVNVGKGTTTVILKCNANGQIKCIIDVWAKVQNK